MKSLLFALLFLVPISSYTQKRTAYMDIGFDANSGNIATTINKTDLETQTEDLEPFFRLQYELGLLMPRITNFKTYIGMAVRTDLLPDFFDLDRNSRSYKVSTIFEYLYLGFSVLDGMFESTVYTAPYEFNQHSYTNSIEHRNIFRWLQIKRDKFHFIFSSDISFDWVINRQLRDFYLADPCQNGTLDDMSNLWNPINRISYFNLEYKHSFGPNNKYAFTQYIDLFSRDVYFNHDPISVLYKLRFDYNVVDGVSGFIHSTVQFNYLDDPTIYDQQGNIVQRPDHIDWRIQSGLSFKVDIWEF